MNQSYFLLAQEIGLLFMSEQSSVEYLMGMDLWEFRVWFPWVISAPYCQFDAFFIWLMRL